MATAGRDVQPELHAVQAQLLASVSLRRKKDVKATVEAGTTTPPQLRHVLLRACGRGGGAASKRGGGGEEGVDTERGGTARIRRAMRHSSPLPTYAMQRCFVLKQGDSAHWTTCRLFQAKGAQKTREPHGKEPHMKEKPKKGWSRADGEPKYCKTHERTARARALHRRGHQS